jgi:eukaryotic-like serine/threonine-protein kinase
MIITCPDRERLRGVLDSSLADPDQAEVVNHLDSCTNCQAALEELATSGSSVREVARAAKTEVPPAQTSAFWPALHRVEREIQSPAAAMDVTRADPASDTTHVPDRHLEFLDPPDDPAHLGQINRFGIVELVGRGGMGMVFRAYDGCLQRTVAVKILDPQYGKNEMARTRFIREARAAAAVAHENVVTIHHVECVEEKGLSFFVMQFVKGRSLQDRLDEGGPLPVREAVRIATQTAGGLAAAHENGLIHRDIKPGNILLEQGSGRVLITDFGLARLTEDVKLTQTGFVAGTPLYMSPEQARGETVDHRSDLFSLGSVLYAMLAGVPPFQGSSPFTVLKQVTDSRHRPVQDVNPAVPESVAEIVDRLMAKDPRHRYADAAEVASALNAELAKLPPEAAASGIARRSSRSVPRYVRSWWRRNSSLGLVAVAAALLLLFLSEATGLTRWTLLGQRGHRAAQDAAELPATPTKFTLPAMDGAVWAVAFDPNGDYLAWATEGGTVRLWDLKAGRIFGVLNTAQSKSPVWTISFTRDGSRLATGSDDGFVRLWGVQTREQVGTEFMNPFPVRSVAMSPDGKKMASGTRNGAVILWDVESGKKLHNTIGHESGVVNSLTFSPDGKLVASAGNDKTVRLWNVDDGSLRANLTGHTGPVYAVAFDPTSELIASAGWDRTIRVWDVNSAAERSKFDVNRDDIWSLAFCHLGKHVLAGGQDGTARWVDIDTGKVEYVYRGHTGPVHAVAVAKDGQFIATGSRDGTVRIYEMTKP